MERRQGKDRRAFKATWDLGLYPVDDVKPLRGDLVAHLVSWVEDGPKAEGTGV